MQAKGLLILGGVTLAAVAAAAALLENGQGASEHNADVLFSELLDTVNDVAKVHIQGPADSLTLTRSDAGWGLVERDGYPVDFSKVKELVMGIARLEIAEPKTSRPEYFAKLGVEDPTQEGSTSKLVTLSNADDSPLASLIVGKSGNGGRGVLVRPADKNQVYLCKGGLRLDPEPKSWIEKEILRLEADRVQSVSIRHPDGPDVEISRDPENHTQFRLDNLPEGRKASFAGVANSVATALTYLGLEDVRTRDAIDLADNLVASSTYRCTDGLHLEATISKVDDSTWVHVEASFQEPGTVGPKPDPESDADGEEANAADEDPHSPEAVRKEVEDLNRRLGPWAFEIPQYKADVIGKQLEDMLEQPAQETPAVLSDPGDLSDPMEAIRAAAQEQGMGQPILPDEDAPLPETGGADLPGVDPVPNPLDGLGDDPLLPPADEEPEASGASEQSPDSPPLR